jgi:DNA-binding NarL/FixJ family response regulator
MDKPHPSEPLRLCLVEDHADLREYFGHLIAQEPGLKLLKAFPNAEEAVLEVPAVAPQVVLVDIELPQQNGIECVRQLKRTCPQMQFLMLTVFEDSQKIFDSLRAGASGYLLKRSSRTQIMEAIHEVALGGSPMSSSIARKVVQYFNTRKTAAKLDGITPREEELLDLLSQGYANKEIADKLGISTETVRRHLKNIYDKLHVHTRTEAVIKYLGR